MPHTLPSPSSPISIPASLSLPLRSSFQGGSALSWPCPTRPRAVLLFIPGNPGNVDWYKPYLDAIYHSSECHGKVEILAVGHRGHSRLESGEGSRWEGDGGTSLEAQVRHKIEVVRAIRRTYPRKISSDDDDDEEEEEEEEEDVKLILIGHSVGAWIGLKVLEELREQVDGLQLLFPTVMNISQTPKARTLPLLLLTSPLLPGLLLPPLLLLVSFVPSIILLAALRIISPAPSAALQATFSFLSSPSAPLNAALMARDEFVAIKEFTPGLSVAVRQLKERGGTIRTYWSRGDEDDWAPSRSREELERAMSLTRVKLSARAYSSPGHSSTLSRGYSSTHTSSPLQSRTLQIGSLAHAAGRKITGGNFDSGSPQAKRSFNPAWHGAHGSAYTSNQFSHVARSSQSYSGLSSDQQQQLDVELASTSSPLRKRTIPMTSSGRRRPSINLAKARRSFDGTITLELPEGENWDYLEQRNIDGTDNNGFREEEDLQQRKNGQTAKVAEDDVFLDGIVSDNRRSTFDPSSPVTSPLDMQGAESPAKQLRAAFSPNGNLSTPPRTSASGIRRTTSAVVDRGAEALSSTVCELGMPHAFCLNWGPQMGKISAEWIAKDWL